MARPKNSARVVPAVSSENVSSVISLSLRQAAAVTGVALWCIRTAIWDGGLRARMAGKKQIVLRSDLEKWIAGQPVVRQRKGRAA
jgi:hypothetical protein